MLPGRRTADGALFVTQGPPPAGTPLVGGIAVRADGTIYVSQAFTPPFSPLDLFSSGEQGAWYDPSDFSTMFQDSAGSTPVTAVGQTVGKILDKSGRNNHASQATAASRPVLQIDGNGKYYLGFDGVDDSLATSSFSMAVPKASVFAGVTNNQSTGFALIYTFGSNPFGVDNGVFGLYANVVGVGDYGPAIRGTTQYLANTSAAAIPRTSVLSVAYDATSATTTDAFSIDINGVSASLTYYGGGAPLGTVFGTWPLYIGMRGTDDSFFNGRIYSLIVRGAPSTTQEIDDTETWVAAKTGVVLP